MSFSLFSMKKIWQSQRPPSPISNLPHSDTSQTPSLSLTVYRRLCRCREVRHSFHLLMTRPLTRLGLDGPTSFAATTPSLNPSRTTKDDWLREHPTTPQRPCS